MNSPKGVRVSVIVNDYGVIVPLDPSKDGSLGRFTRRMNNNHRHTGVVFTLRVDVDDMEMENVQGFTVDGMDKVNKKKNLYREFDPAQSAEENERKAKQKGQTLGNHKAYDLWIQTVWNSNANVLYVEDPGNTLRLLVVNRETLCVEQWEISITDQNGWFFLNQQLVYTWQIRRHIYREDTTDNEMEAITSDAKELVNWSAMTSLIQELVNLGHWYQSKVALAAIEAEENAEPEATNFGPSAGKVVWFNEAKGYGMILTDKGPVRAHWSKIMLIGNASRKRYLTTGAMVRFKALQLHESRTGEKHTQAIGIQQVTQE